MSQAIHDRLKGLGIVLPQPVAPVANYAPFVLSGAHLYISGQLPVKDGAMIKGMVDKNMTVLQAAEAAKWCAVGILAQANAALKGDLSKIIRCVKLNGFVASAAEFADHPKVMNGASDLMVAALGDAGRHARAAVGVSSLPFGVPVEVDAVFEVKP